MDTQSPFYTCSDSYHYFRGRVASPQSETGPSSTAALGTRDTQGLSRGGSSVLRPSFKGGNLELLSQGTNDQHRSWQRPTNFESCQQNLKSNGGLLDQVVFLVRTDNVDDLAYLDQLIANTTEYRRHDLMDRASKVTYGQAWEVVERGTMYIKIDDDIVWRTLDEPRRWVRRLTTNEQMFIEKNAVTSLIASKIAHPVCLISSRHSRNSSLITDPDIAGTSPHLYQHNQLTLPRLPPFPPQRHPPLSPRNIPSCSTNGC